MKRFTTGPNIARRRLNRMANEASRLGRTLGGGKVLVNNTLQGRTASLASLAARTSNWPGQAISNLEAWYLFNNNEAKDCSGHGRDGTYGGGMGSTRDVAEFDGDDDRVDCGTDFLGVKPLTIMMWIRPESAGENNAARFIDNGKIVFYMATTVLLRFSSDGETTTAFALNVLTYHKWQHVCVTRTAAGVVNLYINGVLVGDADQASGTPVAGTTNVFIGNRFNDPNYDRTFHGQMDDARVYNGVIPLRDIRKYYEEGQKNFVHADEIWGAATIFEVQSAAAGDGVYNCYEQTLDATEWTDTAGDDKLDNLNTTSTEVWNILENDPEATYKEMLATGDRIKAYRVYDDEGNARWMGAPMSGGFVRLAKTAEAAPAATNLTCNLIGNDGAEIEAGLGSAIEVYCQVCGGGNLNATIPRLADNQDILVVNLQGKWYGIPPWQTSEDCDCYTAP